MIEYLRERNNRFGRVYWDKLPDRFGQFTHKQLPYAYDVERFEQWYDTIIRWIKKHSVARGEHNDKKYYLENAWQSGAGRFSIFHRYF